MDTATPLKLFSIYLLIACSVIRFQSAFAVDVQLDPMVVVGDDLDTPYDSYTKWEATPLDADAGIQGADLANSTANFTISEGGARSFTDVYSLRGLANTPNFSKPAVVLYVDDVPTANTFSNPAEWLDIVSATVLRGPQGDQFGKNSEAGVIDIRSSPPSSLFRASGSVSLGSYNEQSGRIRVAGPLIADKLFLDLTGLHGTRDGFLRNELLRTDPDYRDSLNGRAVLTFLPGPQWEIVLGIESQTDNDGVQRFAPLDEEPFQVAFDFDGRTKIRSTTEWLKIARRDEESEWMLVSSFRDWKLDPYVADLDFSPAPIVIGTIILDQEQWAEEFRFRHKSGEFMFLTGAYFSANQITGDERFESPGFAKQIRFDIAERNFAVFGNITRNWSDRFSILAGLRIDYTEDTISRHRLVSFEDPTAFHSRHGEWNILPKLSMSARIREGHEAYATAALGFKTGGYSSLETDPRQARFNTERAWTNEIGLRSVFWDKRWETRIAGFYYRVYDYQVERPSISPDLTIYNAPLVVNFGGEVETKFHVFEGMDLLASVGYINSTFRKYNDPITDQNYLGKKTPFTSEFDWHFRADYRSPVGIVARAEFVGSGETFYDEANTDFLRQAPYGVVNLKVGYETARFQIYAFATNLNDARYYTQKIAYIGVGTPASPRTIGITFSCKL